MSFSPKIDQSSRRAAFEFPFKSIHLDSEQLQYMMNLCYEANYSSFSFLITFVFSFCRLHAFLEFAQSLFFVVVNNMSPYATPIKPCICWKIPQHTECRCRRALYKYKQIIKCPRNRRRPRQTMAHRYSAPCRKTRKWPVHQPPHPHSNRLRRPPRTTTINQPHNKSHSHWTAHPMLIVSTFEQRTHIFSESLEASR